MKNWIKLVKLFLLASVFSACTIVPKAPENNSLAPDSSTPIEYAKLHGIYNDGTVGYVLQGEKIIWRFEFPDGKKINEEIIAGIVTENKLKDYYTSIEKYKVRLATSTGYKIIDKSKGVSEIQSKYGLFYRIEASQYANLKLMQHWEIKGVKPDSTWDKLKNLF